MTPACTGGLAPSGACPSCGVSVGQRCWVRGLVPNWEWPREVPLASAVGQKEVSAPLGAPQGAAPPCDALSHVLLGLLWKHVAGHQG